MQICLIFVLLALKTKQFSVDRLNLYNGSILGYPNVSQIENIFYNTQTDIPLIVSPFEIGRSFRNHPIQMAGITRIRDKSQSNLRRYPGILITSAFHARDKSSVTLLMSVFGEIIRMTASSDQLNFLLQNIVIWFIPHVNIDGVLQMQRLWNEGHHKLDEKIEFYKNLRTKDREFDNCKNIFFQGVDLSRNFDSMFGLRGDFDPCSLKYPGPSPFSEKQSQAIQNVYKNYKIIMAFDFQTVGNTWIYPYTFETQDNNAFNERQLQYYSRIKRNLYKNNNQTKIQTWYSLKKELTDGAYLDWALSQGAYSFMYMIGMHYYQVNMTILEKEISKALPDFTNILLSSSYGFEYVCSIKLQTTMEEVLIQSNSLLTLHIKIEQIYYWKLQGSMQVHKQTLLDIPPQGKVILGISKDKKTILFEMLNENLEIYTKLIEIPAESKICIKPWFTHQIKKNLIDILLSMIFLVFLVICCNQMVQRWRVFKNRKVKPSRNQEQSIRLQADI